MALDDAVDLDRLLSWIGRTEASVDVVTPALVQRFRATLDQDAHSPASGALAPVLIHWCLPGPAAPTAALGGDGHPQKGGFLPPVPLPRRMWAGGRLEFIAPIRIGDAVTRRSRIADISLKRGRSGRLCFVAIDHEISTGSGIAIRERQDLVYRDAPSPTANPPDSDTAAEPFGTHRRQGRAEGPLLLRYSALTFNTHRIHYDRDYASSQESYAGLVVHGPLQATLMMEMSCELRGWAPRRFEFRGLRPLIEGPFTLNADDGFETMNLWVLDGESRRTMSATVEGRAFALDDTFRPK